MNENIINKFIAKFLYKQDTLRRASRVILISVLPLSILIFLIGYFVALISYQRPKDFFKEFDEKSIYEGSEKYSSANDIIRVDESYLTTLINNILIETSPHELNQSLIVNRVSEKLHNHLILIRTGNYIPDQTIIKQRIDQIQNSYTHTLDSLQSILHRKGWLDIESGNFVAQVQRSEQDFSTFLNSIKSIQIDCNSDFPGRLNPTQFTFFIGSLQNISIVSDKWIFQLIKSAPVVEKSFLISKGYSESIVDKNKLEEQTNLLQNIQLTAKENYKTDKDKVEEQIDTQISQQRSEYRKAFYIRWYYALLHTIISLLFGIALIRYFIIIRQKNVPRKSTDSIYFATNRTSRAFRIIALLIVLVGILKILITIFLNIFNERSSIFSLISPSFDTEFIFALFDPPITFIIIVLMSWLVVLQSELIDFVSNCYDISFFKAHQNTNYENQQKERTNV